MSSSLRWPDAALAGLGCSMRSASGPAVLAARGHQAPRRRPPLLLAAIGELVVDKSVHAPDRIAAPGLLGRVVSGAYTGHAIAGTAGAVAAASTAAGGTFATWRLRRLAVERTGLPDMVVAAAEDVLCYVLVSRATRHLPE